MNATNELERRIADFYAAEAPARAPDWVLGQALASIDITTQRRRLIRVPWRVPAMSTSAKVAVAAAAAIALGAAALYALPRIPGVGGPTAPPTARPDELRTGEFRQSFTYVEPVGIEFDYGADRAAYWEIRVPAFNDAGHPGGLIAELIGGGRADPCAGTSGPVILSGGPEAVMAYLRSIADLEVGPSSSVTVDGRPGVQVSMTIGPATPGCDELYLWSSNSEPYTAIPRGMQLRLIAVDVGGEHLVLTSYGEPQNASWRATVDQLVASFRFATP